MSFKQVFGIISLVLVGLSLLTMFGSLFAWIWIDSELIIKIFATGLVSVLFSSILVLIANAIY